MLRVLGKTNLLLLKKKKKIAFFWLLRSSCLEHVSYKSTCSKMLFLQGGERKLFPWYLGGFLFLFLLIYSRFSV